MSIISWLVIGLLAGGLGKLIYPGHQGGGIFATMGLGICGAMVGGFVGSALFGVSAGLTIPGLFVAVLGAMICIYVWGLFRKDA